MNEEVEMSPLSKRGQMINGNLNQLLLFDHGMSQ